MDRSTTNYDFVAEKVGAGPFAGLISHSAGFDAIDAGVFRVSSAGDREQAEPVPG